MSKASECGLADVAANPFTLLNVDNPSDLIGIESVLNATNVAKY
jgi:hypothetical protein